MSQSKKKKKLRPKYVAKKVSKLAVPIDHPTVDRGVPPSNKEQESLFKAVLRDPSPISPERAKDLRTKKS